MEEFSYLGSIIASSSAVDMEVDARIAKASRASGALSLLGQGLESSYQTESL